MHFTLNVRHVCLLTLNDFEKTDRQTDVHAEKAICTGTRAKNICFLYTETR